MKAKDDIESIVRPLRKSLGLFEAALAVVDDAIAVFTNEEKLIWCNKSFETFAGESRMRLLGKSVGDCLLGYTSSIDTDSVYTIAKERKSRSPEIKIKNTKRNQSFIIETHFTRYEEKEQKKKKGKYVNYIFDHYCILTKIAMVSFDVVFFPMQR